jgi:hypothetical protein
MRGEVWSESTTKDAKSAKVESQELAGFRISGFDLKKADFRAKILP